MMRQRANAAGSSSYDGKAVKSIEQDMDDDINNVHKKAIQKAYLNTRGRLHARTIVYLSSLVMLLFTLHSFLLDTTSNSMSTSRSVQETGSFRRLKKKKGQKTCIITISATNNFGFVWSLYDSIVQNNPDIDCITWFMGDASEPQEQYDDEAKKGFEEIKDAVGKLDKLTMVTMKEMEEKLEGFDAMRLAFMFNLVELQTTLKPFAFQYVFQEYGADAAMYLDNDIWVTSSLEGIENELEKRSAVITPHCSTPIPHDGRKQTDKNVLSSGVFNFGFVAFSKSAATDKFLEWWAERLSIYGFVDPSKSMFYDQNWGMFIPAFFDHEDYIVLRDLRYNIAYWNLHERGVGLHLRDNIPHLINEQTLKAEPVVFMHFSGMSLLEKFDMEGISRHQNRFTLHDFPDISEVFDAYMEFVSAHYTLHYRAVPYGYNQFSDGTKIEPWMRKLYAAAVFPIGKTQYLIREEEPPYDDVISTYTRYFFQHQILSNPFCATEKCYNDPSKQRFIDWMWSFTPNEAIDMQGDFYYNYIQDKVWKDRPDLQGVFLAPLGDDFNAYKEWFFENGLESVSETLMEKFTKIAREHEENSYKFHKQIHSIHDTDIGLNIIGWHAGKSAESVNGAKIIEAAYEGHIPVNAIELEMLRGQKYSLPNELHFPLTRSISEPMNLIVVNPHLFHKFDRNIPMIIQQHKFNIAYWSGDFDEFPEKWEDLLLRIHEIWCPTKFIKNQIENSTGYDGTTIKVVPVPLAPFIDTVDLKDSTSLKNVLISGKTSKPFVFYTEFDEDSMKRKNPEAVISAFVNAFPASQDSERKFQLIVKSDYVPTVDVRKLKLIAKNDPRVVFINEFLTEAETHTLLQYQDCMVSLHRNDNVGNHILDAMRRRVPVIATKYGAHLEYTEEFPSYEEGSCLFSIPHEMNEYKSLWVEPMQKAAIAAMRKVISNDCAKKLSAKDVTLVRDIEQKYSMKGVGRAMANLINQALPTVINLDRKKELNDNVLRFVGNYNHLLPETKLAHQRNVSKVSLVISHCENPVDWIPGFITKGYVVKDITIYSKCEKEVEGVDELSSLGPVEIIRLPNVGRCDHSFAYWIKNQYQSIIENREGNDVVLFMKDNNYAGDMYRTFEEIFTATTSIGFGCGLKPIWCDCPEGWHQCEENDGIMLHNQTVLNTFAMNHRHVRVDRDNGETDTFTNIDYPDILTWKNAMGLVTPNSETIPVCYGGVFAAKKEQLLKQSLDAWINVEQSLTREDNLVEGHYAERMWGPILSGIGEEFSAIVDSYVGPHVNQTSSCIGRVGMILIPRDRQVFPGTLTIERSPGMTVPK